MTNFGQGLRNCHVSAMIFIKKYIVKLSRISFYEFLKIPIMIIGSMLEKLCLVFFFFKSDYTIVSYQQSETYTLTVLKKHSACRYRICYYFNSFNHSWREKQRFYYFWIFPENCAFPEICVVLPNLDLTNVCVLSIQWIL